MSDDFAQPAFQISQKALDAMENLGMAKQTVGRITHTVEQSKSVQHTIRKVTIPYNEQINMRKGAPTVSYSRVAKQEAIIMVQRQFTEYHDALIMRLRQLITPDFTSVMISQVMTALKKLKFDNDTDTYTAKFVPIVETVEPDEENIMISTQVDCDFIAVTVELMPCIEELKYAEEKAKTEKKDTTEEKAKKEESKKIYPQVSSVSYFLSGLKENTIHHFINERNYSKFNIYGEQQDGMFDYTITHVKH